jgi:ATP-binding cassette subfamily B (MDR/TAP) protein 1
LQDRVEGNIGFKNAEFCYPTRQQVNVLKSLNLSLTPGQKIALVGPSGCGKSTCVQLLQRFYNLHSGEMVS